MIMPSDHSCLARVSFVIQFSSDDQPASRTAAGASRLLALCQIMQISTLAYPEAFLCFPLSFILSRNIAALAGGRVQEVIDALCEAVLAFASIDSLAQIAVHGGARSGVVGLIDDVPEMSDRLAH